LIFGGNIYFDKSGYGYFKWIIQSSKDINTFLNYIKIFPSRSHKRQRLFLVPQFYELKNLQAYKHSPDSAFISLGYYLKKNGKKEDKDIVQFK